MKPTEAQEKWFWEQCGWQTIRRIWKGDAIHSNKWLYGKGTSAIILDKLPPIDLNNLVAYAPDNIQSITIRETKWVGGTIWTQCCLVIDMKEIYGKAIKGKMKDMAALAVWWAIYKALGGEDD